MDGPTQHRAAWVQHDSWPTTASVSPCRNSAAGNGLRGPTPQRSMGGERPSPAAGAIQAAPRWRGVVRAVSPRSPRVTPRARPRSRPRTGRGGYCHGRHEHRFGTAQAACEPHRHRSLPKGAWARGAGALAANATPASSPGRPLVSRARPCTPPDLVCRGDHGCGRVGGDPLGYAVGWCIARRRLEQRAGDMGRTGERCDARRARPQNEMDREIRHREHGGWSSPASTRTHAQHRPAGSCPARLGNQTAQGENTVYASEAGPRGNQ